MDNSCIHCGVEVPGNFCAECGQKTNIPSITWKGLFQEISSKWFGMDNKLARTFIQMWYKPHEVISQYLKGDRVRFIGPISYLFVLSTLYILSFEIFGISIQEFLGEVSADFVPTEQSEKQAEFMNSYQSLMAKNMRVMMFSIIPFMALAMKVFYRKYNFLQHFISSAFMAAQMLWFSVLAVASLALFDFASPTLATTISLAYFTYAVGRLNPQESGIWTYAKSFLCWVVGYLFFVITMMMGTAVYVIILLMSEA